MLKKVIGVSVLAASVILAASSALGQCLTPSFDGAIVVAGGGPGPTGEIASGDLNGDGSTDILIPRFITNTISVIFGSPTGTPTVVLLTSVRRPIAIGVADLNHDSKLDLVVSHETSLGTGSIAVLLGDGLGSFSAPAEFAATHSKPILTADFNNDSHVDVFLGTSGTNVSQMLLGDGSGGLAAPFNVSVPNNSHAVAVDLNNDGKLDIAADNGGMDFVTTVLGDGTGHFGSTNFFPISHSPFGLNGIAAGDFNNDGKLDVVTAGQIDGFSILLGNGAGGLGAATIVTTGFSSLSIASGDFNGDGKLDVTTSGGTLIAIVLGDGNGGFVSPTGYPMVESTNTVVAGDFNGDNKLDVGASNCNSCANAATIFFGDGAGQLRYAKLLNVGLSPFAIASGDLNADGKVDLAVANISHNNVSILIGDGAGNFSPPTNFAVGTQPRSVALGDLNGDQKLDLVTANDGGITILFGDGFGGLSAPINRSLPGFQPTAVAIGDFNNDSRPDLAVAYGSAAFVTIVLANGSGGFGPALNYSVPINVLQLAVHDFNDDGKADLAAATVSGVAVFLGNGAGGLGPSNLLQTIATAWSVGLDDFNRDGKTDIVTTVANTNSVRLYSGDGLGGFGEPAIFTTGTLPSSATIADFNGDRDPDVAINTSGSASVQLGNGAAGLGAAATYLVGVGGPTRSITNADFNSDGRPDLALANQSGTVAILFNKCTATPLTVPSLSVSDVTITEGDAGTATATFTVSLSAPYDKTVSVSFYSAASDAVKDVDYQTTQGRLTFAPGTTSQTINVAVNGDSLDELDEHFNVLLAHPLNATISQAKAVGTILDNDPPPSVSINDVSLNEGNSGTNSAVFTVSLSAPSGKPISLAIATADDSAIVGADYQGVSTTANFSPGQTSQTFSVPVVTDNIGEPDERFLVNLSNPVNVTIADAQGVGTILNDDTSVQFSADNQAVNETSGRVQVTITRTGLITGNSSVGYATSAGTASERSDYNTALGTLKFAPNETSKVVTIFITDDALVENPETFSVTLSDPTGCTLGSPANSVITIFSDDLAAGPNPLDSASFFVRQHYRDFLNREPDAPGLAFWTGQITSCDSPECVEIRRINVSAAFFLSIEFQETGYLAYRFYKSAFGNLPGAPVPVRINDFLRDTQQIGQGVVVGEVGWEQAIENNKMAFAIDFVTRSQFTTAYPTTRTPTQFVDALFANAGVNPSASDRAAAINEFGTAADTADTAARARALRRVAENSLLHQQETNQAFVLMQYFGYLRRNPDEAPEVGLNFDGYNFWLAKLNQFGGNFVTADMVKAFIISTEYRQRFGP